MRIFIGIPLTGETSERIVDIQANYLPSYIRLSRPENLHITLIPPWETDTPLDTIMALTQVYFSPFAVEFHKLVLMPHKRPHMAWLEGLAPRMLLELQNQLFTVLQKKDDENHFRMHVTLARFKAEQRFGLPKHQPISVSSLVSEIVLYRVDRKPSGSVFTALSAIHALPYS